MANQSPLLGNRWGSTGEFRTVGQGIAAALVASGLVKTSDTGQIDWATVSAPGANSIAGYEVYQFNDTLQATVPIYIKVQYACAVTYNFQLRLILTVGSTTDGAGTIGGVVGTAVTLQNNGNTMGSVSQQCYGANDGSGLWLSMFPGDSWTPTRWFILIDRFRDSNGTPNSDGFLFATATRDNSGNPVWTSQHHSRTANTVYANTNPPCFIGIPYQLTTNNNEFLNRSGQIVAHPWQAFSPKAQRIKMAMTYNAVDLGYLARPTITTLGAARTFFCHRQQFVGSADHIVRGTTGVLSWWSD